MDIAFGGMFYAVVDTNAVDELPPLLPENGKLIASLGCQILVRRIKSIRCYLSLILIHFRKKNFQNKC